MAYSTKVTEKLIPLFFEDTAKVIIDKEEGAEVGELKQLLKMPYLREPQEIRSAEEFTVVGKTIIKGGEK